MITKAYIHEYGNGKMEPEHLDVKTELEGRGIECELFTTKRLSRDQLTFNNSTLVVGDHPTIQTVFKRIGYSSSGDCYPKSLHSYLNREIWGSDLNKLLSSASNKEISNVFVKPKDRAKLFTGFVVNSSADLLTLELLPKQTKLYCSQVVDWTSEQRVFVNKSKIVGVKVYEGDHNSELDLTVVERAILDIENSSDRTNAYSLDFGILENGKSTLIEWNDGFAIGSYGLDKTIYTDFLISRWMEILEATFESGS